MRFIQGGQGFPEGYTHFSGSPRDSPSRSTLRMEQLAMKEGYLAHTFGEGIRQTCQLGEEKSGYEEDIQNYGIVATKLAFLKYRNSNAKHVPFKIKGRNLWKL